MRFYDWFMLAGMIGWIGMGVAGHGDAFLLWAFALVLIAGAHDWLAEDEES